MLTERQKNDFKIIFTLLALSITLLAVPILAKQQRRKSTNSSRNVRDQQVKSVAKVPTKTAPKMRSIKPRINIGISRNKVIRSPGRVTNSKIIQPNRVIPSRQTNRATLGRRAIPQLQSSIRVRTPSNTKRPAGISSSIAKPSTISPNNNKNSNRTLSNSRKVITNPSVSFKARIPSIAGPSTQPRTGISKSTTTIIDSRTRPAKPLSRSRISSNKTLDIAGLIGRQEMPSLRPSKSQLLDPTGKINSGNRTRLDKVLSRNQTHSNDSSRRSVRPESGALSRSRIGSSIMKQNTSPTIVNRQSSVESRTTKSRTRGRISSGLFRALGAIGKKMPGNRVKAERTHKNINLRVVDNLRAGSVERQRKGVIEKRADVPNVDVKNRTNIRPSYKAHPEHRPASRDKHRYEHIYWDSHNRLRHRIIWPRYRFNVCYTYGPHFTFRYVYPFYLRRYIFVSLGGYWPMDYCYLRYYWYGCHPYWWYGYYPVAREVTGDTHNYYTYNYYYSDGAASTGYSQATDALMPVDHNTFADVREKLAQQAAKEPAAETAADVQFDEAVKAFEAGDYETAIENFSEAGKLAPDDMILPFAYSQSLFANGQYAEAAEVLRAALAKVSPEKEGVFYPRGLYSDDDILFEQIEHLKQKTESYSFDADLQLLLGYQLLGIGEVDKAVKPLQQASLDLGNAEAATVLLNLVEKIKTNMETENAVQ
jgi:hypothetical protein